MKFPDGAITIIRMLQDAGYEGYLVGGCVRDYLMAKDPHDWDICTNATPDKMLAIFSGLRVIQTGLKHGTITVVVGTESYEVTTYRVDGAYADGRHPNQVFFTSSLEEDLSRRDFTINAMAADLEGHVIDPFGGKLDLSQRVIKCVGSSTQRFSEDWLRVLRALRFAATFSFNIYPETKWAIQEIRSVPPAISAERIQSELRKMIVGRGIYAVLREFSEIFFLIVPALRFLDGFPQHNPHHDFDVWEHTIRAVSAARPDEDVRLALLFHDIAKPVTISTDKNGIDHFYGHAEIGADLTQEILQKLRFDRRTMDMIVRLVKMHDGELPTNVGRIRRLISSAGAETVSNLFSVKIGDALGQRLFPDLNKMKHLRDLRHRYDEILHSAPVFSVKDLAISGDDLIALGMQPGPSMGKLLHQMLQEIMDGKLENTRCALLQYATQKG